MPDGGRHGSRLPHGAGLVYGGGFDQLGVQLLGIAAVFGWVVVSSGILFAAIKATVGLRVSKEEEFEGLDIGEHGMYGYPDTFLGTDSIVTPEGIEKARRESKERVGRTAPFPVPEAT